MRLGDVASVIMGQAPPSKSYNKQGRGVPFVKVAHFSTNYPEITEWTDEPKRMAQEGDVLICVVGKVGVTNLGIDAAIGRSVAAIRPDDGKIDQSFLRHFLKSKILQFTHQGQGAIQKVLTSKMLSEMKIPKTSIVEQKRIAAILDKADEIKTASSEAEKFKSNLIRSTFLELFSEVEPNWPVVQLSDVADITCEFVTPTVPEFNELPHIGPDRIKGYTGEILPYKSAREDNVTSGKFHFSNNEILYSKIRPYLRKCTIPDFEGLCSADIYPLTPKEGIVKEYLWYLLLSDEFDRYTQTLPGRSSIPKLNRTELWRFSFHLPPITLQKEFADVVNSVKNLASIQDLAQEGVLSLVQELLT